MNSSSRKFRWQDMFIQNPAKSTIAEWERKPRPILANPRYPPTT